MRTFVYANLNGPLNFWVFSPEGNSNKLGEIGPIELKDWGYVTNEKQCMAAVRAAYPEATDLSWDHENKRVLGVLPGYREALTAAEEATALQRQAERSAARAWALVHKLTSSRVAEIA